MTFATGIENNHIVFWWNVVWNLTKIIISYVFCLLRPLVHLTLDTIGFSTTRPIWLCTYIYIRALANSTRNSGLRPVHGRIPAAQFTVRGSISDYHTFELLLLEPADHSGQSAFLWDYQNCPTTSVYTPTNQSPSRLHIIHRITNTSTALHHYPDFLLPDAARRLAFSYSSYPMPPDCTWQLRRSSVIKYDRFTLLVHQTGRDIFVHVFSKSGKPHL